MKYFCFVFIFFGINKLFAQSDTVLLKTCYETDVSNPFLNYRTIQIFDSTNHSNTEEKDYWNSSTQSWTPDSKTINYYNSTQDTFSLIHQYWFNGWHSTSAFYTEFDSVNSQILSYNIDCSSGFDTTSCIHYVYDTNNLLIADTVYVYTSGTPSLNQRKEFYYSPTNKPDSEIVFNYISGSWIIKNYIKYFQDILDNDSVQYEMLYNGVSFDSSSKKIFVHDLINNLDSTLQQNYVSGTWTYLGHWIQTYDVLNRLQGAYTTCNICGFSSIYYSYLGSGDSLNYEFSCMFSHGGVGECDSCVYSYQPLSTGVTDPGKTDWNLFPDPASNHINIILSSSGNYVVRIYNLLGEIIFSNRISVTSGIPSLLDVTQIPAGFYLIELDSNNKHIVKKFSIAR